MAKIDEVRKHFRESAEKLLNSEYDFSEFLNFSARMYKLPLSDALLVYRSSPDTEKAAEVKVWNKLGRRVIRGATGIAVFGEKDKCRYLFDITQTVGRDVGKLWNVNSRTVSALCGSYSNEFSNIYGFTDIIENIAEENYENQLEEIELSCEKFGYNRFREKRYNRCILSFAKYIAASRCELDSDLSFTNILDIDSDVSDALSVIENAEQLKEMFKHVSEISKRTIGEIEKRIVYIKNGLANGKTPNDIYENSTRTDVLSDAIEGGENAEISIMADGNKAIIENEEVHIVSETDEAKPFDEEIINAVVEEILLSTSENERQREKLSALADSFLGEDIGDFNRGVAMLEFFADEPASGIFTDLIEYSYFTSESGLTVGQSETDEYCEEMTVPWSAVAIIAKRKLAQMDFTQADEDIVSDRTAETQSISPKVSDLSVGDVILYEGKRREVENLSEKSISLKDLDAPDFGGILLGTSDVLAYDGWQEDMESKGFQILSRSLEVAEQDEQANSVGEQLSFFAEPPKKQKSQKASAEKMSEKTFMIGDVDAYAVLRAEIRRGSGFQDGKFRIKKFYDINKPNSEDFNKAFANMLRNEYGMGGHTGDETVAFVYSDSKGIEFRFRNETEDTVTFNWLQIAKLTAEIIESGEYITQEDIDRRISSARRTYENHRNNSSGYLNEEYVLQNAKDILQEYGVLEEVERDIAEKEKSQEPSSVLGLQLSEGLDGLDHDNIIQQNDENVKDNSFENEKSFSEQVDDVLAGRANRYDDLKVCDTPQILLDVGCEQLPMLYTRNHLSKAVMPKNRKKHQHGLSVEQIKNVPNELQNPVMLIDSMTQNDSIIAVLEDSDTDKSPIIASIKLNGKGHYNIEIDANFITSIYGRDDFDIFLNKALEQDKVLYYDKEKSQELFSVLGLEFPKGLNNLDFNTIIHQSRNIVKTQTSEIEKNSDLIAENSSVSEADEQLATITCEWSESSVFEKGKTYSVYEFDRLMKEADDVRVAGEKAAVEHYGSHEAWYNEQEYNEYSQFYGYDKTKFTVNLPDGRTFTERQDIGDGDGGVIDFLRKIEGYADVIPLLEKARDAQKPQQETQPDNSVDGDDDKLTALIDRLGEHYNELYENGNGDDVVYAEAVAVGDKFIAENPDLMGKLAERRQDFISSDRETAALAFALVDVGLLNNFAETDEIEESESVSVEAEKVPPKDYVFDSVNINAGGAKTRFNANVAAVKTLKKIESEKRYATAEEQAVMARYVGWGGLSQAFDPTNSTWTNEYNQLLELLTPDEYASARSSTNTSFYTPPEVVDGIYQGLKQFGFESGNILEPSCGIGNFFSKLPQDMKDDPNVYGIELDSISGRIAHLLYPSANIQIKGFEHTKFSDNSFDVVIGNVPFGNYKVADRRYDKLNLPIHEYFVAKSIDQIKPGGIIAVATSKYTLDKKSSTFREYMAQRCNLLGAIRLPNNAFKDSAGTEVTSDILFLQKRETPTVKMPYWTNVGETEDGIACNAYFLNHPQMVLGKMAKDERMAGRYGENSTATTCIPDDSDIPLAERIEQAVSEIKGKFSVSESVAEREDKTQVISADPTVRNFTYTLVDGNLYYRENEFMRKITADEKTLDRMKGLHKIRQAQMSLINAQASGCSDEQMTALQGELNRTYDTFVKAYGRIGSKANRCFANDDDFATLEALEFTDKTTGETVKAPIFYKRTVNAPTIVEKVQTAEEALLVSLDRKGRVDIDFIAEISDRTVQEAVQELDGKIFANPEKDNAYEEAGEYLSGNVRRKLKLVEAFSQSGDDRYEKNIEALKKVLPETIPAEDILVRISAPWISLEDYNQFFEEYVGEDTHRSYSPHVIRVPGGEYKLVNGSGYYTSSLAMTEAYGTHRMNAAEIFTRLLNQRDIVVKDRIDEGDSVRYETNEKETRLAKEKGRQMDEAFKNWIFNDLYRREKYVETYNELFNSLVGREYDGSYQHFDGMNPDIELRPHQKDAVLRAKLGGNTLLAHVVGAGKSFEMTAATMEKKRLGLINKACVAVPKPLVEQLGKEWRRLYPSAKLLIAGKDDFTRENRKRFIAKCATGDYDAIIMSHNQFEKNSMSSEYKENFIQKQIDQLENNIDNLDRWDTDDKVSIKSLERQKKNLEARLKKLTDTPKDESLTFEQLGIDYLVVDEAHYFKNCFVSTKMGNISGVQTSASNRAEDMLMKCDYMNEKYGCSNIIFSTGTPISNSMTEMYVMTRYLRPDILRESQIENFDDWAATYGEVVTKLETKPTGQGLQMKRRFSRFVNIPELSTSFRDFADVKTADMINLPVPKIKNGEPTIVVAKPDMLQKEYMNQLVRRTERIHCGGIDPTEDNMLKITHEARLLGLDSRCFYPNALPSSDSKFEMLIENLLDIYENTKKDKGVQVVFCDIAVNSVNGSFSVYDAIKERLVDEGIDPNEICFASEGEGKKSTKLYEQLRQGEKRFVIASTSKLGTGVNIQDRLCAIHHLDIPWKPSDYEQRNGRGIRQGNMFSEIEIFHYVTQDTFDTYMMDTIVRKSKFINQIMTSRSPARVCEDMDDMTLTYAKVQAATTSNPYIVEHIELQSELQELKMLKSEHQKNKYSMQKYLEREYPEKQQSFAKLLEKSTRDVQRYEHNKTNEFTMLIDGKNVDDKKKIVAELDKARLMCDVSKSISVGQYAGFDVLVEKKEQFSSFFDTESPYSVVLQGELKYSCDLGTDNGLGNIRRIETLLEKTLPERKKSFEKVIDRIKNDKENAEKIVSEEFEREDELRQKEERFEYLSQMLSQSNTSLPQEEDDVCYVEDNDVSDALSAMSAKKANERFKSGETAARGR